MLSERQVWMSIFHIINLKKNNSWTQGSWNFLTIKTNPGFIFLLKGIQSLRLFFFILKVANIRCFILIAVEIFHNIIRI